MNCRAPTRTHAFVRPVYIRVKMEPYSRLTLGILATVAVFGNFFIKVTFIKALGIQLNAMRDAFDTDTWVLGSIFALIECGSDLLCKKIFQISLKILPVDYF